MTAAAAVLIRPHGGSSPRMSGPSTSAPVDRQQTRGKAMDKSFGIGFEQLFADRFARFLRENFANPTQVAAAFNVRERTAEYWWTADRRPGGAKVAWAFKCWPEEAGKHLTGQDTCDQSSGQSSASSSSSATSSQPEPTGSQQERTGSRGKRRAA